jgi:hypothetical protein
MGLSHTGRCESQGGAEVVHKDGLIAVWPGGHHADLGPARGFEKTQILLRLGRELGEAGDARG